MVEDLNMDVEIIGCPIVREKNGLAISSRNTYLSPEERNDALLLNKSLKLAKNLIENGEKNISTIKREMEKIILSGKNNTMDYIEFVDTKKLEPVSEIQNKTLIAIAIKAGNTRLIDNMVVEF